MFNIYFLFTVQTCWFVFIPVRWLTNCWNWNTNKSGDKQPRCITLPPKYQTTTIWGSFWRRIDPISILWKIQKTSVLRSIMFFHTNDMITYIYIYIYYHPGLDRSPNFKQSRSVIFLCNIHFQDMNSVVCTETTCSRRSHPLTDDTTFQMLLVWGTLPIKGLWTPSLSRKIITPNNKALILGGPLDSHVFFVEASTDFLVPFKTNFYCLTIGPTTPVKQNKTGPAAVGAVVSKNASTLETTTLGTTMHHP